MPHPQMPTTWLLRDLLLIAASVAATISMLVWIAP
jgi:hypothetical protein